MPPLTPDDNAVNPIRYNSDGYPDELDLDEGYDPDEDERYWDRQYEDWLPEDEDDEEDWCEWEDRHSIWGEWP